MKMIKSKKEKEFHSFSFFREVKKRIAEGFEGETFEQKKELINKYLSGELDLTIKNPQ